MSKSKLYLAIGFGTLGLLLSAGCFAALGVIQNRGAVYPDTLKANEAEWIRTEREANNNDLSSLSLTEAQRDAFLLSIPVSNDLIFEAYGGEATNIDLSMRSEFTVFGTTNYPSYVLGIDEIKATYPEGSVTFWNSPGGRDGFTDDDNGWIFYEYTDASGATINKIVAESAVQLGTVDSDNRDMLRSADEVMSTLGTFTTTGLPTSEDLIGEVKAISNRINSATSQAVTTGIVLTVVAAIALGAGALLLGYSFYKKSKGKGKKSK